MAETIELKVLLNDSDAVAKLNALSDKTGKLDGKTVKIKLQAEGLDKMSQSVVNALKGLGKLQAQNVKLAAANAKMTASQNQLAIAQQKTAQAASRAAAQLSREQQEFYKTERASKLAAAGVGQFYGELNKGAGKGLNVLGQIGNRIQYIIANAAISIPIQGMREALSTMKEVDKELTNIQKVTDMGDGEIAALGKGAYKTASQYGVRANEYLQNIGTFSKAGYKEAAQGLGELAVKTQLVGDVSAETASQFLLSTDAAYKYKGSVTALSGVLDKANAVENNYATSIEKIAEGMPIVANVAATAGMSVNETIAMLGTITAVTQESGTKAATAARALILNIMGDTTTEIEEGVSLTAEQVDSLSGILWKYSADAMKAAQATGSIVNPMEAIAGLAKASQEGLLTEAELATIASSIGGKLRTNQLLALINNFGMFTEMLETMQGAAGSADKEVGAMLGSWESKSNILKNSWTELVSNLIETDTIKSGLDGLTGLVQGLDSEVGRTVITVGALTAAMALLGNGGAEAVNAVATGVKALATGTMSIGGWVAVASAAILGLVAVADALTLSYEEASEKRKELESEFENDFGQGSEYDQLINKAGELTKIEERRLEVLKQQRAERDRELQDAKDAEYQAWQNEYGTGKTVEFWYETDASQGLATASKDYVDLYNFSNQLSKLNEQRDSQEIGQAEYADAIGKLVAEYSELVEKAREYRDEGREVSEAQNSLIESFDLLTDASASSGDELVSYGYAMMSQFMAMGMTATEAADAAAKAIQAFGESSEDVPEETETEVKADTGDAEKKIRDFIALVKNIPDSKAVKVSVRAGEKIQASATGTKNAPGGPTLVNERGPELISANGLAYIAGGGAPTVTNLPRGAIVLNAQETRRAMGSLRSVGPMRAYAAGAGFAAEKDAAARRFQAQIGIGSSSVGAVDALWNRFVSKPVPTGESSGITSGGGSGGYGGGGGGGPAGPDFKTLENELDELLDNLDLQIKLAKNQNDTAKELSLQATAAEKIKELVEKYQAAGYSATSNEVLKLLNRGYGYSDDIMGKLVAAIEDAANATGKANALEERRLKVEEANTALSNAQKQRTVRVFNSETGQWEWIADQSKVKAAQDSLKNAQESYKKEQQNQLIDALKNANLGDLDDLILGEGILANLNDNPELLSAFANALGAVSGAADRTAGAKGESIFKSSDSHDTIYEFPGGITLTEEQAKTTTLKQLADQLRVLKLA